MLIRGILICEEFTKKGRRSQFGPGGFVRAIPRNLHAESFLDRAHVMTKSQDVSGSFT